MLARPSNWSLRRRRLSRKDRLDVLRSRCPIPPLRGHRRRRRQRGGGIGGRRKKEKKKREVALDDKNGLCKYYSRPRGDGAVIVASPNSHRRLHRRRQRRRLRRTFLELAHEKALFSISFFHQKQKHVSNLNHDTIRYEIIFTSPSTITTVTHQQPS